MDRSSFPRKREPMSFKTQLDPRFRGGDFFRLSLAYRLDARRLQDAAHAGRELVVELGELGGVLVAVLELVVLEELAPRRRLRQAAEDDLPVGHVLRRDPGRRNDAAHPRYRGHVE